MTCKRRDGQDTPFGAWLRANTLLDSRRDGMCPIDQDFWIHRYMTPVDRVGTREIQHLMFVEVKCFGAVVPEHERDTFSVVHQILRQKPRYFLPRRNGLKRLVHSWGVHLLVFSDDSPQTSEWIRWDKTIVTPKQLTAVLKFELNPFTLRPRSERRHHTPPPTPLFG